MEPGPRAPSRARPHFKLARKTTGKTRLAERDAGLAPPPPGPAAALVLIKIKFPELVFSWFQRLLTVRFLEQRWMSVRIPPFSLF